MRCLGRRIPSLYRHTGRSHTLSSTQNHTARHFNIRGMSRLASSFTDLSQVKKIWKGTNAVCFDVDSTVITGEGIDVLADFCGKGKEVAQWTANAMTGAVPFHEALEARLSLFKPSTQQIEACNQSHQLKLTEGIAELISTLRAKGKDVFLVSGGFRQMIAPHASELGISADRIFANNLLFDAAGEYSGFDEQEPTSRAGGKATVVQMLKSKYGYASLTMIGDGYTDLEARPPADIFIGFGGIAVRESVKDNADWFVTDFSELTSEL